MRSFALVIVALALLAAPAHAAPVTQFGPPPVQGDCFVLGLAEGTKCYYGVGGLTFSNSPHILRVGETMGVNMTSGWDSFLGQNGPVIRTVTNTLDTPSPLNYKVGGAGACLPVYYFAASASCTLEAVAATGGWRTQGFTLSISSSRPYESGDYYGIVGPDTYEIAGTLRKHNPSSDAEEPVSGVTVTVEEVGGDGDKYTQVSNLNGRYSVLVDKGTWRVRTNDRRLCHETTSGSGCSRAPQTTTPGDRQVNFQMPKPVKISGTVTTKDGEGVKDAKLRLRADGDAPRETVSAKDGTYSFDEVTPGTAVTLDSTVKGICPKLGGEIELLADGSCKTPAHTVTPDRDLTVDFEKPGCVKTLDFHTSMIAKGECFTVEGPDHWTTDKPFRMNGLDFEPSGTIDFDGAARTVWFKSGATVVWLPRKNSSSIAIGTLPPVVSRATFVASTVVFTQTAGFGDDGSLAKAIGGFPIGGKVSVTMTAGQSAVAGTLILPRDPGVQFGWKDGGFTNSKGEAAEGINVGFVATTDNDNDWRTFEVNFESGFKSPLFSLKSAKASYDIVTGVWTIGGSIIPEWLRAEPGSLVDPGSTDSAASGAIEGSISATGVPFFDGSFRGLTAGIDGLNVPINGAAWLQRLRMGLAMQALRDGTPFSMTAGVGLSLGPKVEPTTINVPLLGAITIKPAERASLDGDFTVSWSRMTFGADNDLSISGAASVKVWDMTVGSGTIALYPVQGLFGGSLTVGLTDPSGGTLFAQRGRGEIWLDGRAGRIYFEGAGNMSILGVGANGDVVITGPDPMIAGACMKFFGYRIGLTYNYSTGEYTHGESCDLAKFRALKPLPPEPAKAAVAAARSRSFKASGDEGLLAVEVPIAKGPGAPPVTLVGPGVKLTSSASKGVKRGTAMAFPNPAKHTVSFVVAKPRKGTYRLSATGATRLGTPHFARPLPEPQVDGELDASSCSPTLTWRAAGTSGQTVRLVEKSGDGAVRVLGESKKAKGTLKITPMPAGGRSEVSAQVVNGATVRATIPLGTYTSQVGDRIPGPRAVAVTTAKKGTSKLTWKAVCGAESYSVRVGSGKPQVVRGTSATVTRAKKASTVTVVSLGRGAVAGGSTLMPLPRR